jgi:hypothetical protein
MSVLASILERILQHSSARMAPETGSETPAAVPKTAVEQPTPAGLATLPATKVDVGEVLHKMDEASGEHLNYKSSIIDLLKLLGLDSSLDTRRGLAEELGYPGDYENTPVMNTWLHKAVIERLEERGGAVPLSLKEA